MAEQTDPVAQYPHQLQDEVTQGDLVVHMAEHPEMYHDGLTPHINRVLGQVVSEVTASVEEHTDQDIPDRRQEARDWLKASGIVYEKSDDDDSWIGLPTIDTVQVPQDLASDIALVLIEDGDPTDVLFDAKTFPRLDNRVANAFLEAGSYFGAAVVQQPERYSGVTFNAQTAARLIEQEQAYSVLQNVALFEGFTPTTELACSIIETQAYAVLAHKDMFPDLTIDDSTAAMLQQTKQYEALLEHADLFPDVTLNSAFADRLIDEGMEAAVLRNADKFSGIDFVHIAERVVAEKQNPNLLGCFIEKIPERFHLDIAAKILADPNGADTFMYRWKSFTGILQSDAFSMLLTTERAGDLVYNLQEFDQLNQGDMLKSLIKTNSEMQTG